MTTNDPKVTRKRVGITAAAISFLALLGSFLFFWKKRGKGDKSNKVGI